MYNKLWLYIPVIGMIIALCYYHKYGIESFPLDENTTKEEFDVLAMLQAASFVALIVYLGYIVIF